MIESISRKNNTYEINREFTLNNLFENLSVKDAVKKSIKNYFLKAISLEIDNRESMASNMAEAFMDNKWIQSYLDLVAKNEVQEWTFYVERRV